ncbi:MAG: DUF2931 family protein [Pseudomonadota bacterium]|nr:DUF2931 family protein [Pseudomonadota bacterium]
MDKYDWGASESAPGEYPMEIVTGKLIYKGQNTGLYVPNEVFLQHRPWGRGRSTHVSGPEFKPLPERLEIKFFSYSENQFYVGSFELPYEKILALFQKGYYSPDARSRWVLQNNDEYRKRHRKMGLADDHSPYDGMLVGITPGGGVAVWATGSGATTEIFFGQAEKADLDWRLIIDNPKYPREEYVREAVEDSLTPEALAALQKNGIPFGLWQSYRVRYPWQPLFTGMAVRESEGMELHSFNGERTRIDYPVAEVDMALTRVVPESMGFIWMQSDTKGLIFDLKFDEAEIFAAFKQLGSSQQPLQLEMRMDPTTPTQEKLKFSVWLRNSSEAVELRKITYTNQKKDYSPSADDQ